MPRRRLTTAGAVLTCALAPAYTIRWHIGPLPTTVLEISILATLAAFAYEQIQDTRPIPWRSPLTVPAVLFLVAGAVSIIVAPDRRAALGLYRAYMVEPIAFGLVAVSIVTTVRHALALAAGLGLGGLIAGLANAFVVLDAIRRHAYDVVNTPPVVIYNTANSVALYLVPLIALAGALALHAEDRRRRAAAAVFAVAAAACVVLSFSRGGYLALVTVALGLALSHRWRWPLLGGLLVVGLALAQIPALGRRIRTEVDLGNPSNTLVGRFHLWSATLQMLRARPLTGGGLAGFAAALAPYWNKTNADRFAYPHNILLNFWTETGLLGVVAFSLIVGVAAVRVWRGWRRATPDWRPIHLGVLLALVAVVVHGLVDVPYWKNDLSLEFWVLLALVFAPAARPAPAV